MCVIYPQFKLEIKRNKKFKLEIKNIIDYIFVILYLNTLAVMLALFIILIY